MANNLKNIRAAEQSLEKNCIKEKPLSKMEQTSRKSKKTRVPSWRIPKGLTHHDAQSAAKALKYIKNNAFGWTKLKGGADIFIPKPITSKEPMELPIIDQDMMCFDENLKSKDKDLKPTFLTPQPLDFDANSPPVKYTAADLQNEIRLRKLFAEQEFERVHKYSHGNGIRVCKLLNLNKQIKSINLNRLRKTSIFNCKVENKNKKLSLTKKVYYDPYSKQYLYKAKTVQKHSKKSKGHVIQKPQKCVQNLQPIEEKNSKYIEQTKNQATFKNLHSFSAFETVSLETEKDISTVRIKSGMQQRVELAHRTTGNTSTSVKCKECKQQLLKAIKNYNKLIRAEHKKKQEKKAQAILDDKVYEIVLNDVQKTLADAEKAVNRHMADIDKRLALKTKLLKNLAIKPVDKVQKFCKDKSSKMLPSHPKYLEEDKEIKMQKSSERIFPQKENSIMLRTNKSLGAVASHKNIPQKSETKAMGQKQVEKYNWVEMIKSLPFPTSVQQYIYEGVQEDLNQINAKCKHKILVLHTMLRLQEELKKLTENTLESFNINTPSSSQFKSQVEKKEINLKEPEVQNLNQQVVSTSRRNLFNVDLANDVRKPRKIISEKSDYNNKTANLEVKKSSKTHPKKIEKDKSMTTVSMEPKTTPFWNWDLNTYRESLWNNSANLSSCIKTHKVVRAITSSNSILSGTKVVEPKNNVIILPSDTEKSISETSWDINTYEKNLFNFLNGKCTKWENLSSKGLKWRTIDKSQCDANSSDRVTSAKFQADTESVSPAKLVKCNIAVNENSNRYEYKQLVEESIDMLKNDVESNNINVDLTNSTNVWDMQSYKDRLLNLIRKNSDWQKQNCLSLLEKLKVESEAGVINVSETFEKKSRVINDTVKKLEKTASSINVVEEFENSAGGINAFPQTAHANKSLNNMVESFPVPKVSYTDFYKNSNPEFLTIPRKSSTITHICCCEGLKSCEKMNSKPLSLIEYLLQLLEHKAESILKKQEERQIRFDSLRLPAKVPRSDFESCCTLCWNRSKTKCKNCMLQSMTSFSLRTRRRLLGIILGQIYQCIQLEEAVHSDVSEENQVIEKYVRQQKQEAVQSQCENKTRDDLMKIRTDLPKVSKKIQKIYRKYRAVKRSKNKKKSCCF